MERARSPHLMCVPCGLDPSRRMTFRDAFQSLTGNGAHGMELLPRHCEEPLRRSNPFSLVRRSGLLRCARNDGQKQVLGEWMTQKGIDSSRPVTEAWCAHSGREYAHQYSQRRHRNHPAFPTQWFTTYSVLFPGTTALLTPSSARRVGVLRT